MQVARSHVTTVFRRATAVSVVLLPPPCVDVLLRRGGVGGVRGCRCGINTFSLRL